MDSYTALIVLVLTFALAEFARFLNDVCIVRRNYEVYQREAKQLLARQDILVDNCQKWKDKAEDLERAFMGLIDSTMKNAVENNIKIKIEDVKVK